MERLPSCAGSLRLRLLYAQPPPLLCGRASASQRSLVASLPPPQTPEKRRRLLVLLQLSSGVKATGGRAESEGVAHVFDFPTRARCVDVHAISWGVGSYMMSMRQVSSFEGLRGTRLVCTTRSIKGAQ